MTLHRSGSLRRSQVGRDSALVRWTRPGSSIPANRAGTVHESPGSFWAGPALQARDAHSAGIFMAHPSVLPSQVVSESTPGPPTQNHRLCLAFRPPHLSPQHTPGPSPIPTFAASFPCEKASSRVMTVPQPGVRQVPREYVLLAVFGGVVFLLFFLLEYRMCTHAMSL